uniref:Uncharacterized protein n=1 Tax=Candidatus Kentrum sp. LFY TaxID=2126342 RepID=A0A450UCD3_9GAMM|nr:MAG: hypothetical protein BECKLFY1418B_GA0070995_101810 [Candidatus Kentron sp. LFY]
MTSTGVGRPGRSLENPDSCKIWFVQNTGKARSEMSCIKGIKKGFRNKRGYTMDLICLLPAHLCK